MVEVTEIFHWRRKRVKKGSEEDEEDGDIHQ
jgi:hypothetical protein